MKRNFKTLNNTVRLVDYLIHTDFTIPKNWHTDNIVYLEGEGDIVIQIIIDDNSYIRRYNQYPVLILIWRTDDFRKKSKLHRMFDGLKNFSTTMEDIGNEIIEEENKLEQLIEEKLHTIDFYKMIEPFCTETNFII